MHKILAAPRRQTAVSGAFSALLAVGGSALLWSSSVAKDLMELRTNMLGMKDGMAASEARAKADVRDLRADIKADAVALESRLKTDAAASESRLMTAITRRNAEEATPRRWW